MAKQTTKPQRDPVSKEVAGKLEPEPEQRAVGRPPKEPTLNDLIIQMKEAEITANKCLKAHPEYKLRLRRAAGNLRRDIEILKKVIPG